MRATAALPGSVLANPAWRSNNLGALLFAASSRVIAVKLAVVRAAGFTEMTAAQLALFHVLDDGGTRLSVLAVRARLSKASMTELVDRAEASGLAVRQLDPIDARGRIVAATANGHALLAALVEGLAAAEADIVAVIGAGATARLRDRLDRYAAADETLLPPPGTDAGWATANFGRLFALAAARFTAEVVAIVTARGFAATPALLGMVRHLDLTGSRLTDLAAAARMTKPAMRELVDRSQALGFVDRRADPSDRRARTIAFAPHGLALLDAVRAGVAAAETALAGVGTAHVADLYRSLARLAPTNSALVRPAPVRGDALTLSSVGICHRSNNRSGGLSR